MALYDQVLSTVDDPELEVAAPWIAGRVRWHLDLRDQALPFHEKIYEMGRKHPGSVPVCDPPKMPTATIGIFGDERTHSPTVRALKGWTFATAAAGKADTGAWARRGQNFP